MSNSNSNSNDRDFPSATDEIDPLLPIPENTHAQRNQTNHLHGVASHSHGHSPNQRRLRRPSFGTTFLSSPNQRSRVDEASTSPKNTQALYENTHGHDDPEIDALGMMHNNLSGASIGSDLIGGGNSFIDHTRFSQLPLQRKSVLDSPTHRLRSSTSSSSNRNKYIPAGVQHPPPQIARPSFAEQWVKRQNSADLSLGGPSLSAASRRQSNPFIPEVEKPNYGSISHSAESKSLRRNSAERRYHLTTPHHSRYEPMRETPFTDDYTDTIPQGQNQHHRVSSSESDEFEFSGSNPSSRRSSDSASLDDVCFPLAEINDRGGPRVWPDVQVLKEFAEEEIKELEVLSKVTAEEFRGQQQQQFNDTRNSSVSTTSLAVGFQNPLVTSIDSNTQSQKLRINETEPINGRLRPPKLVPWDPKSRMQASAPMMLQSETAIPTMQHNNFDYSKSLIEQFRFTYFREELESTIHSPNISGLVRDGQSFEDLFVASHYSNPSSNSLSGSGLLDPSNASRNNNSSGPASGTPTVAKTPTPSVKGLEQNDVSPFWLDVLNPTEEEMKVLSKAFGIHPLTTEDIFLGETREKVELFRDYYLVCFRSFDIVHERYKQKKAWEKKSKEHGEEEEDPHSAHESKLNTLFNSIWKRRKSVASNKASSSSVGSPSLSSSLKVKQREQKLKVNKQKGGYRHKPREGELAPLNMYIIVFREGVITFHFAPTPHPVNVRRRARLLRDYLTVSADWIGYALIDDITDAFAPMIESIEDEVNSIEDAILKMNSYDSDDDSDDSDDESSDDEFTDDDMPFWKKPAKNTTGANFAENKSSYSKKSKKSNRSSSSGILSISSTSSSTRSTAHIAGWKRKGDMLRRIGECRKKVMSILRLLGSKADVIKGFAKRCNEQWEVAPRSEIGMYLGDIQDHIVTMVQSLNHYEKLLARSHSNYLAQINIDMTRVNNDMNDVLGKITILGTVVLPMNIITGLWGMNVIVPGQDVDSLRWFFGILVGMCLLAFLCFMYARRAAGFIT